MVGFFFNLKKKRDEVTLKCERNSNPEKAYFFHQGSCLHTYSLTFSFSYAKHRKFLYLKILNKNIL